MELINSGTFESLPVGASATNASMAEDSDGDYSLLDDGDDTPAPSARAQAKEAAKKAAAQFSSMLKRMLVAERPAAAKPSKTRCKRDLGTLDLELAPLQPSGKRQRKPVAHFEAGSAQCFVRAKADAEAVAAAEVAPKAAVRTFAGFRTDKERGSKAGYKNRSSSRKDRDRRAQKKAAMIAELSGKLESYEDLSWAQRRNIAIKTFVAGDQCAYERYCLICCL